MKLYRENVLRSRGLSYCWRQESPGAGVKWTRVWHSRLARDTLVSPLSKYISDISAVLYSTPFAYIVPAYAHGVRVIIILFISHSLCLAAIPMTSLRYATTKRMGALIFFRSCVPSRSAGLATFPGVRDLLLLDIQYTSLWYLWVWFAFDRGKRSAQCV